MRSYVELINALGVPILEVKWWERSSIISKAEIAAQGLDTDFALAEYEAQFGVVSILLFYSQYFWGENLPQGQLLRLTPDLGYWRLYVDDEAPDQGLAYLREQRRPWSPNMGSERPVFYYTAPTSTKPTTQLIAHPVIDWDVGDYAVGGFITGIDVPRQYFDQELVIESRGEG